MRIESTTLSSFRCFGPDPITVPISSEITAVVGPNAAGKTALLHALSKMFGVRPHAKPAERPRAESLRPLIRCFGIVQVAFSKSTLSQVYSTS